MDVVTSLFSTNLSFNNFNSYQEQQQDECTPDLASQTPGQDCHEPIGLGRELKNFAFYALMVVKSVIFTYKLFWLALRYYHTTGKCNTFEVWFCAIAMVRVGIILPLYFMRDINLLWLVFVLNSFSSYFLSYVLGLRACVALNQPREKVQWTQWMFFV